MTEETVLAARVEWTPEADKLVAREHEEIWGRSPLPDAAEVPTILAKAFADLQPRWERAEWPEATRDVRDRILARGLGAWIDAEAEAGLATLFAGTDTGRAGGESIALRALVARWLAGSPARAMEALARMWSFRVEESMQQVCTTGTHGQLVTELHVTEWLVPDDAASSWGGRPRSNATRDAARILSRALARDAKHAEALAAASGLRASAPLPVRVGLAAALRHGDWANEETAHVVATPRDAMRGRDAAVLQALVTKAETISALIGRFGTDDRFFRPADLVRRLGISAAPVLVGHLGNLGTQSEKNAMSALATLVCDAAAEEMARRLAKKSVNEIARVFFAAHPDFAFAALAPVLAAKSKLAPFAEPVARALAAEHGSVLEVVAARLEPAAAEVLRRLAPVGLPDEASEDELPRVLARPPWRGEKRPPPKSVPGVTTLPFEERVHLGEADLRRWSAPAFSEEAMRAMYTLPPHAVGTAEMDALVLDRLRAGLHNPGSWIGLMSDAAARAWLSTAEKPPWVHFDLDDLGYLLARFGREAAGALFMFRELQPAVALEALRRLESPRVAVLVAEAMRKTKNGRTTARAWFSRHPEAAAIGLVPAALASSTEGDALAALHLVPLDAVKDVVARLGVGVDVDALLAYEVTPKKVPDLPAFFAPAGLPPVVLVSNGKRLSKRAATDLGILLALSEPSLPHPRLEEVREACTPESLANFAWALFEAWMAAGADGKQDWALGAVGHLGGDEAARRLAALVRTWPGEGGNARAVKAVDVLATIGSDVALTELDLVAEKVRYKALQTKARLTIERIAEERGLGRDELADRITPTLGLDPDGSRTLSFGRRVFKVGFDEHLEPFVRDENEKVLSALPKPRADEDGVAAVGTWKAIKKDAKTAASIVILRLERGMCTQRRWMPSDFRAHLVEHPLVVHLARRLLWATYEGARRTLLFRVAEDRSVATVDDAAVLLPDGDGVAIGLPHRLELDDAEQRAWGEKFAEYELVQPFPQLARETYLMTDAERTAKALARASGAPIATGRILGLEARGWRRGQPQDGGWVWEMRKPLHGDVWAELPLKGGILVGAIGDSPAVQEIGEVVIRRALERGPDDVLALGDLPPLAFSELVREIEALRA